MLKKLNDWRKKHRFGVTDAGNYSNSSNHQAGVASNNNAQMGVASASGNKLGANDNSINARAQAVAAQANTSFETHSSHVTSKSKNMYNGKNSTYQEYNTINISQPSSGPSTSFTDHCDDRQEILSRMNKLGINGLYKMDQSKAKENPDDKSVAQVELDHRYMNMVQSSMESSMRSSMEPSMESSIRSSLESSMNAQRSEEYSSVRNDQKLQDIEARDSAVQSGDAQSAEVAKLSQENQDLKDEKESDEMAAKEQQHQIDEQNMNMSFNDAYINQHPYEVSNGAGVHMLDHKFVSHNPSQIASFESQDSSLDLSNQSVSSGPDSDSGGDDLGY